MHRLLLTALLTAALAGPLDINTADEAALRAAGFTASQAAQIVGYRGENGAFLQVDELLAVPQVSRAALAPLRDQLTIGGAPSPPATAPVSLASGGPAGVQAKDVTAEWRNLYGVIVYAVNGSLENGGAQPLHAIKVRVDLLDRDGKVVATGQGYNLGAEGLLDQPDTALDSLPAGRRRRPRSHAPDHRQGRDPAPLHRHPPDHRRSALSAAWSQSLEGAAPVGASGVEHATEGVERRLAEHLGQRRVREDDAHQLRSRCSPGSWR